MHQSIVTIIRDMTIDAQEALILKLFNAHFALEDEDDGEMVYGPDKEVDSDEVEKAFNEAGLIPELQEGNPVVEKLPT